MNKVLIGVGAACLSLGVLAGGIFANQQQVNAYHGIQAGVETSEVETKTTSTCPGAQNGTCPGMKDGSCAAANGGTCARAAGTMTKDPESCGQNMKAVAVPTSTESAGCGCGRK